MTELPAIENGTPVRDDLLVFGSPLIEDDAIDEVVDSLRSGWLGTGPKVQRFEEMFREHLGSGYCAAVNSCTAGLHLSLAGLGIGPGDEVIVPTMTFCASANAVFHVGAKPVFAEVELATGNIDPTKIEALITPRTKAIMVVHFAGRPCDMDTVMDIAKRRGHYVVEDCAHAIEAQYKGQNAGVIGDIAAFSFYVTKNICTGEGGMIATRDEDVLNKVKILALHGLSKDAWKRFTDDGYKHYSVVSLGYKYNMMDIQAALGIRQLPKLAEYSRRREGVWNAYQRAFADLPLARPPEPEPNTRHARHLYTIQIDPCRLRVTRDHVLNALQAEGIGAGVHYIALHLQPFYQGALGYRRGDFPVAEQISERTLSIPLSAKLTDQDVQDVISAVRKVFRYYEIST